MTTQYSPARILVVDSYTLGALGVAAYLEQALHIPHIDTARTGPDAVQSIKKEPYHLLIINDDLDFTTGAELIRRIRADRDIGHVPIIAASFEEGAERELRRAGANYFHRKSTYSSEQLLALTKRGLNYSFCPPVGPTTSAE